MVGANSSYNDVFTDKAPLCNEEVRRRRMLGAEKIVRSDEKKCRGCDKEEGPEKHRLHHCPRWKKVRNQILKKKLKMEAKGKHNKHRLEVAENAALQYAASFRCLVEELKNCEELKPKPKEKWIFAKKHQSGCTTANKDLCMRCGRGGKCGPKWLNSFLGGKLFGDA